MLSTLNTYQLGSDFSSHPLLFPFSEKELNNFQFII